MRYCEAADLDGRFQMLPTTPPPFGLPIINCSFSIEIDLMELKMRMLKNTGIWKKWTHHGLKSDEMSFRVPDPSILKSDANYG